MILKLRVQDGQTITRTETDLKVEHLVFKDNVINPLDAKVQLLVRKHNTSGILELSKKEWKELTQLFETNEAAPPKH